MSIFDTIYSKTIRYYSKILAFDLHWNCINASGSDYTSKEYKDDEKSEDSEKSEETPEENPEENQKPTGGMDITTDFNAEKEKQDKEDAEFQKYLDRFNVWSSLNDSWNAKTFTNLFEKGFKNEYKLKLYA